MPADPVLWNDWHPVAAAASITGSAPVAARLLGLELALWRDASGGIHAWEDRCPHRGTRFSLGRVDGDALICAYHGWHFQAGGRCTKIPAETDGLPRLRVSASTCHAQEHHGLVWVCPGTPRNDVPAYPEYADPRLRAVLCGPYDVAASGPRIVENFLDMGHFSFVHEGILGTPGQTAVRDYQVTAIQDEQGVTGLLASGCFFFQPQTNALAHQGTDVEYSFRVVRPLTAILTKLPQGMQDYHEAISLHVQPLSEDASRVWIVLAMTNFEHDDADLRAFQDRIFLQDLPILENQIPKRLPLTPRAEVSIRADRMSLAYRNYLREAGLAFGVITA